MILKAEDVSGQGLDHLGIVSSVIARLKLVEKINARLPVSKEKGAKVSMGQRVAAMILNGLGFTDDRLYLFPDFLKNKPVERLLGKGLQAADFNDDATGRCLDEITDYVKNSYDIPSESIHSKQPSRDRMQMKTDKSPPVGSVNRQSPHTQVSTKPRDIALSPEQKEIAYSLRGFVRDPKTGQKVTDNRTLEEIYKRNLMRGNG